MEEEDSNVGFRVVQIVQVEPRVLECFSALCEEG